MKQVESVFLDLLSRAIRGQQPPEAEEISSKMRGQMARLAREHGILPLIVQGELGDDPVFGTKDERRWLFDTAKAETIHQATRTAEFLLLYEALGRRGLRPAVLKGVICRSIYPAPEQRPSTDEDLLIAPEEFPRYHEALLACGLELVDPDAPLEHADEVSYRDDSRGLYVELHMRPFGSDASAYGACNRYFEDALSRTVELPVYGMPIRTLSETDHLLYLLCHAYKHFLHGGVGIRQCCDIALFAQRFADRVDWDYLCRVCGELRIDLFAAAMFRIGEKHLGIAAPKAFAETAVDELPLLEDCLTGGLYGTSDMDRLHSSTLTLEAVSADRAGRKKRGAMHSVFLSANSLAGRYPYLRKHPWLLPVAWTQRVWGYVTREKANPGNTLRIGQERIALLRQYHIIEND